MAWPAFSTMQTEIRNILGETTALKWTDAEVDRFLNDAQRDIAIKSGCYESIVSITTTASSREVPFAGYKVNSVEYQPGSGNRVGLQRITPKMLGHLTVNGVAPQFYFVWGNKIILEPLPGATTYTLSVHVSQWPDYLLVEDADTPFIPSEFRMTMLPAALSPAFMKTRKYGTSGSYYQQYIAELQDLITIHRMRRKDYNAEIRIPDTVQMKMGGNG